MSAVLAQAIDTPRIDWVGIGPLVVLASGALIWMFFSSLVRVKAVREATVWWTAGTAVCAALATIPLWSRVTATSIGASRGGPIISGNFVVDGFGVFITVVICCAVFLGALLLAPYLRREGLTGPEPHLLLLLSAAGGVTMAMSYDLIVLFLGLEILSISLYVLAGSHVRRAESQEAAMKYFILGAAASAVWLYGAALVYGATGSSNFGTIALGLQQEIVPGGNIILTVGMILMLAGFGFKIAAVPFHLWTPDVYQGAPTPITGYMAAAAKTAAFGGLLRVLFSVLATERLDWRPVIWVLAVVSVLVGSVLAVVQTDIKRMLAYSSISHVGFILIGVEAASDEGRASSLFYLLTYTFIVLGSFAVVTVVGRRGDNEHSLDAYSGLSARQPLLALSFTLFLLAQAGVPLTSGFMAKFRVITAAADAESYLLAVVAMLGAVIAAFFYLRIIVKMYMSDSPEGATASRVPALIAAVIFIGVVMTLIGGILPGFLLDFAREATLR